MNALTKGLGDLMETHSAAWKEAMESEPALSPAMTAYAAWRAAQDAAEALEGRGGAASDGNVPDAVFQAAIDAAEKLCRALIATPARGAGDVLAKMASYCDFGAHDLDPSVSRQLWGEARQFLTG